MFIPGLDTIRFACAMVVAFSHLHIPMLELGPFTRPLEILWANLFNGAAAVMVFFVISGLCIHLPTVSRGQTSVSLPQFYARRALRIALPSAVALVLYMLTDAPLPGVLWSVICEAVYYLLYPVLLLIARRIGWGRLTLGCAVISMSFVAFNFSPVRDGYNDFMVYGTSWTWLIGLPMWIAGCWLAENISRFPLVSLRRIALLSVGLLGLTVVLRVVKFHVPAPFGSNVILLTFFTIPAVYWLGHVARHTLHYQPRPMLDGWGRWSFSLYLVHPAAFALLEEWIPMTFWTGFAILGVTLLLSWLFYLAIESPTHRLARNCGRALEGRLVRAT